MLAWIQASQYDDFSMQETTRPNLGLCDVRVSVRSIGVNRADILQRKGLYPAPTPTRNDIIGLEFAGVVMEKATNVPDSIAIGARVMGIVAGEAYAEEVVIDYRLLLDIPAHISFVDAVAIPEAFLTAYDALFTQGSVSERDTVLVHAIASGVGDAVRQLCSAYGIHCIGTTRSAGKKDHPKLAHTEVFVVQDGTFPTELRERRVDLIVDFVGANYFSQNLRLLQRKGRLVLLGLLGGHSSEIPLALVLQQSLQIKGSTLRSRPLEEKIVLLASFRENCMPLYIAGKLEASIDRVYSWKDAKDAHAYMLRNENFGKIVLTVD